MEWIMADIIHMLTIVRDLGKSDLNHELLCDFVDSLTADRFGMVNRT
jgi:hypothetical protein